MDPIDSDFVDEIVQDRLPTHMEPPRDIFLPWHRVRKEYIRHYQWNMLTSRMIQRYWRQLQQAETEWLLDDQGADENEIQLPTDVALERTPKCLLIPGDDLLDVRALWRDIQPLKCAIRYLGFNESQGSDKQGTRVHVANNAVTSLPLVFTDSRVLHDRFEMIRQQSSQAYRYLKEYGPYHVVNLDLCGSMFPNTAKDPQEYYEALRGLLAYQFEHQREEWLLFITTMVEPAVVQADKLCALCNPTRQNVQKYEDFAEQITKFIPVEVFQDESAPVNITALSGEQMVRLFGVALGKWLLTLCQSSKPQWTIAMRRSYCYATAFEKGAAMLSLAFELKPNISPPIDTTGMTKIESPQRRYPDERECAVKIAESVANIRDVDTELSANPELKMKLRDAQASLLEAAGYDRAAYLKWVESGEVTQDNRQPN